MSQPVIDPGSNPARDSGALARLPRLPRWGARTDVQMVDLYTRGSLHVIFWFLVVMGTLSSMAEFDDRVDMALAVLAALLPALAGARLLRAAMALYPDHGPLPRREILAVVALSVPVLGWISTLGQDERPGPALVLVGTLAWALGGLRDRRVTSAVVLAGAVVVGAVAASPAMAAYGAALAAFFVFTVQSSLWLLEVVTELDRGRSSQAALAVAEERLRFSRDVHDVMGRHLATIAVQAELAATLAERGDERAAGLVREVRGTAHEAMREARELARGYRPLDLDQELQGAVSLLGSAGIQAHADLAGLPRAWHPPVARLVREAVTNVLRHSAATWVRIGYDAGVVEVRNDRVLGRPDPAGDGSGLRTLSEELAGLGAGLTHDVVDDEFVVRLTLSQEAR